MKFTSGILASYEILSHPSSTLSGTSKYKLPSQKHERPTPVLYPTHA